VHCTAVFVEISSNLLTSNCKSCYLTEGQTAFWTSLPRDV